jgi:hypothetical protein
MHKAPGQGRHRWMLCRKDVRSMRPFYGVAIRVAARCLIHMVVDAATSCWQMKLRMARLVF